MFTVLETKGTKALFRSMPYVAGEGLPKLDAPAIVVIHPASVSSAMAFTHVVSGKIKNPRGREKGVMSFRGRRRIIDVGSLDGFLLIGGRSGSATNETSVAGQLDLGDVVVNVLEYPARPASAALSGAFHTLAALGPKDDFSQLVISARKYSRQQFGDLAKLYVPELDWLSGSFRGKARSAPADLSPAEKLRKHILDSWPLWNASEVHTSVSTTKGDAHATTASRFRIAGKILGLRVGAAFQYPTFQFNLKNGQPRPEMKDLIALMPKDETGWLQASWLAQPTRELAAPQPIDLSAPDAIDRMMDPPLAIAPVDLFQENPGAVLAYARKVFEGTHD